MMSENGSQEKGTDVIRRRVVENSLSIHLIPKAGFSLLASLAMIVLPMAIMAGQPVFKLDVVFSEDGPYGAELRVDLTNQSSSAVEILKGHLPWAVGLSGMWVKVAQAHSPYSTLEQVHPMGHSFVPKTVRPGETLRGAVSLRGQFVDFEHARRKGALIAHWHWEPTTRHHGQELEYRKEPVIAGWVIIPKTE